MSRGCLELASNLRFRMDASMIMRRAGMVPDQWQRRLLAFRPHRALLLCSRQLGKPVCVQTRIPTPTGWTTFAEVKPGDEVFDENGKPVKVLDVHPVEIQDCYRVTFSDGASMDVSGDHLWTVLSLGARQRMREQHPYEPPEDWASWVNPLHSGGKGRGPVQAQTLTTKELLAGGLRRGREYRWAIPTTRPLDLPRRELLVEPWCLGYWLGNGASVSGQITTHGEDLDAVAEQFECSGYRVSIKDDRPAKNRGTVGVHWLKAELRELGVLGDKHIPEQYLRASGAQRYALLRGLMDSDGTVCRSATQSNVEWMSTDRKLVDGFVELARTLGFKPRVTEKRATLYGVDHGPAWRVQFTPHMNPFLLERKGQHWTGSRAESARPFGRRVRGIESIERLPDQPVRCIKVDNANSLFLAGDGMVPTHNTTSTAALALHKAIIKPEQTICVVSPTQRQSSEVILRVRRFLGNLPEVTALREAVLGVELDNHSRIIALPGQEHSIRGNSPDLLVMDEASRISDGVYHAAIPMLTATAGDLIALSTPRGQTGWFYELWENGDADEWHREKIPYTEISRLDPGVIALARASMPEVVFAAEYECSFAAAPGAVFSAADIDAMFTDDVDIDDLTAEEIAASGLALDLDAA